MDDWAELLFATAPQIHHLTFCQRIHYGVLPLHGLLPRYPILSYPFQMGQALAPLLAYVTYAETGRAHYPPSGLG